MVRYLQHSLIKGREKKEYIEKGEVAKALKKLINLQKSRRLQLTLTDNIKVAIAKVIKSGQTTSYSLALDIICREWMSYKEAFSRMGEMIKRLEHIESCVEEIKREVKKGK